MGFQDEMKQMFLRIAAGDVEPEEWETWWNSNRPKLEETLTRGEWVGETGGGLCPLYGVQTITG